MQTTDPATAMGTSAEPVLAVMKGHKAEHLARSTITTTLYGHQHTGMRYPVATTGHPFWDVTRWAG